ncbi:N-acetylmuramoyl-L-alanine amidase [Bradyrhizobium sp. USDA 4523]
MANRAKHLVFLGCGLLCAAASVFAIAGAPSAAEGPQNGPPAPPAASAPNFPVASGARLAGDAKQTRFILDLDRKIEFRAFPLADPYRVVVDIPQVDFQLAAGTGSAGRGLVKAFRYGLVMPGGSRIVFDLTGPVKIANSYVLDAANGQPPRLVLDFEEVDRTSFVQSLAPASRPESKPAISESTTATIPAVTSAALPPVAVTDARPLIVIDPGHGGIDNGTQSGDQTEKNLVLGFGLALRDRIEKSGKYRVVMTRSDDTFIPLNDRVKIARSQSAALFVSIHADALPRREGDAQGATIYTVSDKASDAEAERLAEAENKADAIAGVNLTDEPTEVADILIDLARAARNQDVLQSLRPSSDGRDEDHGADAQASAQIGRLPGAEGARRAVRAGRDRLRLQQGGPRAPGLRELAEQGGRLDGAGDRHVLRQTAGNCWVGKVKSAR